VTGKQEIVIRLGAISVRLKKLCMTRRRRTGVNASETLFDEIDELLKRGFVEVVN
jgi:hypothetical protein